MSNEAKGMEEGATGRAAAKAKYSSPKLTKLGDFRTITATGSGSQNETPAAQVVNKMP